MPASAYTPLAFRRPDAEPPADAGGEPRVLVYSQRAVDRRPWVTPNYEFEDVVAAVDRVDLVAPGSRTLSRPERLADWWRGRATGRPWPDFLPRVQPTVVDREYDLFFGVFQYPNQLPLLEEVHHWRRRCRVAVCMIIEFWRPSLEWNACYLPLLDAFDHVFLVNAANVDAVGRRVAARCSFLPFGVDAERFCPYPVPPPRGIDVYSYGRRSPGVHAALLDLVEREGLTYLYDTLSAGPAVDYREHRLLTANLGKRSRYAPAFRVNDNPDRLAMTGGEDGLVLRYFEGTAAGTVLLGSRPRCPEHDACFDWPDSTVDLAFDGSDVREVLAALDAQPERVARIRRDNVVHSLRRHDWLYRWRHILDVAGLPHTPAMADRARRLEALAQMALADGAPADRAPAGGAGSGVLSIAGRSAVAA